MSLMSMLSTQDGAPMAQILLHQHVMWNGTDFFLCSVKSIFYSLLFFKIQNVGEKNLELLIDLLNFKVKDSFRSSIKPWKNYTSFNLAFKT